MRSPENSVSAAPAVQAVVLKSALLDGAGVPHAFSTRVGGVSSGMFSTLNFGNPAELAGPERDPRSNIQANIARLLGAAGCPGLPVVQVHQVHGPEVRVVSSATDGAPDHPDPKADAIVVAGVRACALVRIADCAPVLLASDDGAVVAAVHAGWRGVVAPRLPASAPGVVSAALERMRALGARSVIAAIGPCIGAPRFEVGPEVAAGFREALGADAPVTPGAGDRAMIDLKAALRLQLVRAGVDRVDVIPGCTFDDDAWFFSHRRERGLTGRMAAVIAPRLA